MKFDFPFKKFASKKHPQEHFVEGNDHVGVFLARIFFGFLFLPEKRRVEKRNNFSPADSSFF